MFSTNQCNQCQNGEYSLDRNDAYCHKCPENAVCNYNGSFIDVQPGFWRENYFSTEIFACYIQDACLGNTCQRGYEGPLCDSCVVDQNSSFFKTPNFGCVECNTETTTFVIMAIVKINNFPIH